MLVTRKDHQLIIKHIYFFCATSWPSNLFWKVMASQRKGWSEEHAWCIEEMSQNWRCFRYSLSKRF